MISCTEWFVIGKRLILSTKVWRHNVFAFFIQSVPLIRNTLTSISGQPIKSRFSGFLRCSTRTITSTSGRHRSTTTTKKPVSWELVEHNIPFRHKPRFLNLLSGCWSTRKEHDIHLSGLTLAYKSKLHAEFKWKREKDGWVNVHILTPPMKTPTPRVWPSLTGVSCVHSSSGNGRKVGEWMSTS